MIIFNSANITGIIFNVMGNILSRIQKISTNEGISIGALERKIGASKGVLSRAINNGTDIQSKWLQIIVDNYPQYSTRWLLTGEGSMLVDEGAAPTPNGAQPVTNDANTAQMMQVMLEQAKEIGRLQEQVRQLTIEQEKTAARANTAHIANAG